MINYHNKTAIKLIFFILAQTFLLTSIVYPASATNKDTSNIYIQARHLRVPMMGAEKRDDRLSAAINAVSNEIKESDTIMNELVNKLKPKATLDTFYKTSGELIRIAGESSESAIMVSKAILNRLTVDTDNKIIKILTIVLCRIVEEQPSKTLIVINAIAERVNVGATDKSNLYALNIALKDVIKSSYLKDIVENSYLKQVAEDPASVITLVERLKRAQIIISNVGNAALIKNIKPYIVGQASIMFGAYKGRIMIVSESLEKCLFEYDEIEAIIFHEIGHLERGDDKRWRTISSLEDKKRAEQIVRDIELAVDKRAVKRLLATGKDPRALIRVLAKGEEVGNTLETKGFLTLSNDPRSIPTPSIQERIEKIEAYLKEVRLQAIAQVMQMRFNSKQIPAELKNFYNTITGYIKTDKDRQEAIILALTLNIKLVENGIDPNVILEDALPVAAAAAKNIDELRLFISLGIKLAENGIDPYDTLNEVLTEVVKVTKDIDELKLCIDLGIKLAEKKIDPYVLLYHYIPMVLELEHTPQDFEEICDAISDLDIRDATILNDIIQKIATASNIGELKNLRKVTTEPAHDIITSSDISRRNI